MTIAKNVPVKSRKHQAFTCRACREVLAVGLDGLTCSCGQLQQTPSLTEREWIHQARVWANSDIPTPEKQSPRT